MRETKKGFIVILAVCLAALLAPRAAAAELDGFVGGVKWAGAPVTALIRRGETSFCTITDATMACIIDRAQSSIMLGFTVRAPDITPESPVGAELYTGGRMVARWQNGVYSPAVDDSYPMRGAAWFPPSSPESYCTFVIELGSLNPALQHLEVRLLDPLGAASKEISSPVIVEAPATTARPTTTTAERTTTTRATTTERPTTTKAPTTTRAPTTARPTTTKAPTTERPTTTAKPGTTIPATAIQATATILTTTAPPPVTAPPLTFSAAPSPVTPQPSAAPAVQPAAPQYSVGTTWYTVVVTEAAPETTAMPEPLPLPVFTTGETAQAVIDIPMTQAPAPESVPASRDSTLLYAAGGLLVALALGLVGAWFWAQRRQGGETDEAGEDEAEGL